MTEKFNELETAMLELLDQKLEHGDPDLLDTLLGHGIAYMRDRLGEQVKRSELGGHLPDSCTMQPVILRRLLRIVEEAKKRLMPNAAPRSESIHATG